MTIATFIARSICVKWMLFIAVALCCVSCTTSAPTRLYILRPSEMPATQIAGNGGAPMVSTSKKAATFKLGVQPIELAGYLDRSQIVTEVSSNQLALANLDEWAEPLKDSLNRLLIENLKRSLGSFRAYSLPAEDDLQITHKLVVRVVRFETSVKEAIVEARWSVVSLKDKKEVLSRYSSIREAVVRRADVLEDSLFIRKSTPEVTYDAEVAALNVVFGKLTDEILRECQPLSLL